MENLKFGQNPDIWLQSWNLVKILIFGQNPEIWLKSWSLIEILKLGHQKEPLAQVTKCSLQVAPLALDPNLVIRWRHLHLIQIWSSGGATCIATLPGIVLLSLSASIELASSSARVTSVKSAKRLGVTYLERPGPIDRTPGKSGSDKNMTFCQKGGGGQTSQCLDDYLTKNRLLRLRGQIIHSKSWFPETAEILNFLQKDCLKTQKLFKSITNYYQLLPIITKNIDSRTFDAEFYYRDLRSFSRRFFETENQTLQIFARTECMCQIHGLMDRTDSPKPPF